MYKFHSCVGPGLLVFFLKCVSNPKFDGSQYFSNLCFTSCFQLRKASIRKIYYYNIFNQSKHIIFHVLEKEKKVTFPEMPKSAV